MSLYERQQPDFDSYITNEPHDYFTPWIEEVYNHLDPELCERMDQDGFTDSDTENFWLNELHIQKTETKLASQVLSLAFKKWEEDQRKSKGREMGIHEKITICQTEINDINRAIKMTHDSQTIEELNVKKLAREITLTVLIDLTNDQ